MNLQELKEIINNEIKHYIIDNGKHAYLNKNNKLLFKQIKQKYNWFSNISELIYLYRNINNLENLHIFCNCGNKNNFYNTNIGYGYYCSIKCCTNDNKYKLKIRKNRLNNIDENGLNSYQRAARKQINTKRNDIDENGLNCMQRAAQKAKQKMLNDIDENGLNAIQRLAIKSKNSNLNNIINGLNGYQRTAKNSVIRKKNNIDENGLNSYDRALIKCKQTWLNKYGVDNPQKSILIRNKVHKTNIIKYGVKETWACKQLRDKYIPNNILKGLLTKTKNNTFNKSKLEEECYNLLLQKFNKNDIIRQYRNKKYPFSCDFYIKSLDLYIECHFYWTHHPFKNKCKPFKNSVEDLQEMERLKNKAKEINFKNKNKKQYLTAIYVWSILDPLKLQTFKQNKLHYKIFYKIDQFKNWYNKI